MLPDRVSNPGPLTYESGAIPIALRGPASWMHTKGWTEERTDAHTSTKSPSDLMSYLLPLSHAYRWSDRWTDGHANRNPDLQADRNL